MRRNLIFIGGKYPTVVSADDNFNCFDWEIVYTSGGPTSNDSKKVAHTTVSEYTFYMTLSIHCICVLVS